MVDVVDKKTRSRMMAGIKGKNTKPEMLLRRALHAGGFRYRIHDAKLPGKPDLVFPMYEAVVFIHGCFWHQHPECWWNTTPAANAAFWKHKLGENAKRDKRTINELQEHGWRIAIVWECSLRLAPVENIADTVGSWLKTGDASLIVPEQIRKRCSGSTAPTR